METIYFQFEFAVEGLTQAQADELLDVIVEFVESKDGTVGGGFHRVTEVDDGTESADGSGAL